MVADVSTGHEKVAKRGFPRANTIPGPTPWWQSGTTCVTRATIEVTGFGNTNFLN